MLCTFANDRKICSILLSQTEREFVIFSIQQINAAHSPAVDSLALSKSCCVWQVLVCAVVSTKPIEQLLVLKIVIIAYCKGGVKTLLLILLFRQIAVCLVDSLTQAMLL